ncbi:hypothetical protein AALB81_12900 [Lachnospiraceae bacterium 48-33]
MTGKGKRWDPRLYYGAAGGSFRSFIPSAAAVFYSIQGGEKNQVRQENGNVSA